MTDAQAKLIAAAIVLGSGVVALAIGILAMRGGRMNDWEHVLGIIVMAVGLWCGYQALKQMKKPEDKPDGQ